MKRVTEAYNFYKLAFEGKIKGACYEGSKV